MTKQAIATLEKMEEACREGKYALTRYAQLTEQNRKLMEENRELKKELKIRQAELNLCQRELAIVKDGKQMCPQCQGEGGFEVDHGPFGYEAVQCKQCEGQGAVEKGVGV